MVSFCHIHSQLNTAVLQPHVGCLKRLERRECSTEHSSLEITHFLQHLRIKQQSKSTWVVLERTSNNYMFMYISSELQEISLYKYSNISRQLARTFNTKRIQSLSQEFNLSLSLT